MALHTHTGAGDGISHYLSEVLLESIVDALKILPFLFLTYLLMEFIEHKASDKLLNVIKKSGNAGPLAGGVLGAVPQCAFSAVCANLYTGRVISLGTLIAVFLSTSDEMLPIMISESVKPTVIFAIIGYKFFVAVICGFAVDIIIRLFRKKKADINIDEICENDNCHCERGIFYSAIHHTLTITAFIFIVTLLINTVVFFVGTDTLANLFNGIPVVSHIVAAIIGLVPGCATSVVLTTLGLKGIISAGTMICGLCSSAGVGILILFRLNKHIKENLLICAILVMIAVLAGGIADIIGFSALLS